MTIQRMKSFHFTGYYKIRLSVVTICDSSDYYILRQHVITIYDGYVITIHDTCYNILRQVLQFTTSVITIHDRYYNSRHYYISRQNIRLCSGYLTVPLRDKRTTKHGIREIREDRSVSRPFLTILARFTGWNAG